MRYRRYSYTSAEDDEEISERSVFYARTQYVRIGVLLMFFSILSEFLTIATPQSTAQTILIGMLEMTTGISKISSLNTLSLRYKSAICLFLLGFGGICVHIQVRQAWQQSDFPIFRYILVRFLFGLCSSLCFLFLNS